MGNADSSVPPSKRRNRHPAARPRLVYKSAGVKPDRRSADKRAADRAAVKRTFRLITGVQPDSPTSDE